MPNSSHSVLVPSDLLSLHLPNCYQTEKALKFYYYYYYCFPPSSARAFCLYWNTFPAQVQTGFENSWHQCKNVKTNSFDIVKKQVRSMKLSGSRLKTYQRKYFFMQYIIKLENSLPGDVVKAQWINVFKNLGKFMEDKVISDYWKVRFDLSLSTSDGRQKQIPGMDWFLFWLSVISLIFFCLLSIWWNIAFLSQSFIFCVLFQTDLHGLDPCRKHLMYVYQFYFNPLAPTLLSDYSLSIEVYTYKLYLGLIGKIICWVKIQTILWGLMLGEKTYFLYYYDCRN